MKHIKLLSSTTQELFQYCVAQTMGCHETQLHLGYKFSTAKAREKAHSLETLDEYLEMQQEIILEHEKCAVLWRKASKASKQLKVLKVIIKDQQNKAEKKVHTTE